MAYPQKADTRSCPELGQDYCCYNLPWAAQQSDAQHRHSSAVSAVQDQLLRLWDLRMALSAAEGASGAAAPSLVGSTAGQKEPVAGFATHSTDVIAYAGPPIGVLTTSRPFSEQKLTPTKLMHVRGSRDTAAIAGLCMLPTSRLLVVGCEDGVIKLCR